jgi:hypothetical protein
MTVGQRVGYPPFGFSDGKTRWMTTRRAHVMTGPATDIRLVYGNVAPGNQGGETPGPNAIAVTAQIEYPDGHVQDVLFNRQRTALVRGGDLVSSDPVGQQMPKGTRYFIRTNVEAMETPYKWPLNTFILPELGDWLTSSAEANAMFATADAILRRGSRCFGPYNILGRTVRQDVSVAIVGDSVVATELSFVARALDDRIAWFNCAIPGDSLVGFLKSRVRLALIDGHATHVICALGIGDIRQGNEDLIKNNFLQVWRHFASRGMKVFQTTITTDTASSDKWTSTDGQVLRNPNFAPGGIYHRINAWIRTLPPPLQGCFDASAQLETAPDSGIWIAPDHAAVTNDGPHLNELGAEIASRCIDIKRLRL